jgi:sulfur carrier protein
MKMIEIFLNGEQTSLRVTNLLQAMQEWEYTIDKSAVAINGEFVPRSGYSQVDLKDGDEVDVVGAVGGG